MYNFYIRKPSRWFFYDFWLFTDTHLGMLLRHCHYVSNVEMVIFTIFEEFFIFWIFVYNFLTVGVGVHNFYIRKHEILFVNYGTHLERCHNFLDDAIVFAIFNMTYNHLERVPNNFVLFFMAAWMNGVWVRWTWWFCEKKNIFFYFFNFEVGPTLMSHSGSQTVNLMIGTHFVLFLHELL